ncbi:hypothetical protein C8Q73DRAFT_276966 [Cubamyces lactineus]|nr:hypothetical protein C8Q73DRAFT_276966 [Cubamyces lactineus]
MGPTTSTVLLSPSTPFLALFIACVAVAGVDVNRTIDDQKGDSITGVAPLFLPTDLWNIGQTCTSCVIRAGSPIDPGQVFDGTWHDATHYGDDDPDRIVQVSFTGHAIYVYHTIMNILVPGASTRTNLTFLIDSNFVGNYLHNPTSNDSTPAVFYQMLVYSNDALEQGEHTLQVVASGDSAVLILFDYVMYTTVEDEPEPPFSSQSPPHASSPNNPPSRTPSQSPPSSSSQPPTHSDSEPPSTTLATTALAHSSSGVLSSFLSSQPGSSDVSPFLPVGSIASTNTPLARTSQSQSQPSQPLGVSSTSQHHRDIPIGSIVGSTIGGVAFVACLLYVVYRFHVRRRQTG